MSRGIRLSMAALFVGLFATALGFSQSSAGDGFAVLENTQKAFRSIASSILPTVVEVDVVDTIKKPALPFSGDSPFQFFFRAPGTQPDQNQSQPYLEYQQQGLGSGILIRRDGNKTYVLTNSHVVGGADKITIRTTDGTRFDATLVGQDTRRDLALVIFETTKDLPVAPLGDSSTLEPGDLVLAVGNPLGFESSITFGIVSAVGRQATSQSDVGRFNDYIQTDASINQGNSGGPLVNIRGEVVGINTWIASQTGGNIGLGFAIPINNAKRAIDDFISKGRVDYGWLGVAVYNPPSSITGSLPSGVNGAFVSGIYRNSAADKAGILPGDVITRVNGQNVGTSDELSRVVGNLTPGSTATISLYRAGRSTSVSVVPSVRSENVDSQARDLWPGLLVVDLSDEIRSRLNLQPGHGDVVIGEVQTGSPAANAGLRPGDIIREVNSTRIKNVKEFYQALNDSSAGRNGNVMFRIYRKDGELLIGLIR